MKFAEQFYLCMPYLIGCDTMSCVWHRRGCLPVKGNEESPFFFNKKMLMWTYKISQEDIIKAEENALVSLYTGI